MSGPAIRLLPRSNIAGSGGSWFPPHDIAFHIVFAAAVFARWFDFRCGSRKACAGEPATPGNLRRYLIGASANWVRRMDGCQRFIGIKSRLNGQGVEDLVAYSLNSLELS
jgi:hypothetical protein